MGKVVVELSGKQAEQLADQLLNRLDAAAKLRLSQKLERATRRARWEPLVLKMRQRFAQHPLSAREIRQACELVRGQRFETRRRAADRH